MEVISSAFETPAGNADRGTIEVHATQTPQRFHKEG
jgi:hypothetical protein